MSSRLPQVIRASQAFRLDHHHLPGFPFVLDHEGFLIEPIFAFLRSEAVQRHMAAGTLLDEAYVLRTWWHFVTGPSPFATISVDTVVQWTGLELSRNQTTGKGRSKRRLSRCLDVIGRFHRYILSDRIYAAGSENWRSSSYLARLDPRLRDASFAEVSLGHPAQRLNGGRPTPSEPDVERVLDALASRESPYLAARDWLLGRWMRDVGLRRAGVASLTVESLAQALIAEGILERHESLTTAGSTKRSRSQIRGRIEEFRKTGRSFICGEITEKGGRTRETKIPFSLVLETLDYVWGERTHLQNSPAPSGPLWLSVKTRRGLTAAAIGDIVKQAFRAASVKGSGHRLRACYAEEIVFRLYDQAKTTQDILFDENQILIDAAEAMGHSNWKSLRHYLNRAARNYAAQARQRSSSVRQGLR